MKRRTAKAYRFRLHGSPWITFIGAVRNKDEATKVLRAQFGSLLDDVHLHFIESQRTFPERRVRADRINIGKRK